MLTRMLVTGITASALLWLSGCGMPASPMDSIKPPVYEGASRDDKFHAALHALLPQGARILVSDREAGGQGILYEDVDGDGSDEALIVYEQSALKDKELKAALLKQRNEDWRIVWDTKGFGYGLDYAGFSDVNEDGIPEIVLGWSLGEAGNGMDIYEWKNNTLQLWATKEYSDSLSLDNLLTSYKFK
ncbi:hypothetical protein WMW72_04865 [Paenibacillus filicis]|uniref:VCBS repeat-containing protein n=1 Tax=Paenibacillus filicis TaxID=669464 RepID=A0ABU9DEE9_9BACL